MNFTEKMRSSAAATLLGVALLLAPRLSHAHLGYGGRDFGTFNSFTPKTLNISGQNVTGNFGWADGTDSDFGDSHKLRIYKIVLDDPTLIYITAQGPAGFLPAFSLYSGLASSIAPDHDGAEITVEYLLSIGGKEGAFYALGDWKVGNDLGTSFDTLTTFTYVGHAADGTSANFGPAPGISGDGAADNFVTQSFSLPAGSYSLFVGGANYAGQSPTPDTTTYPVSVTVTNVPEPGTAAVLFVGLAAVCATRRRRF